MPSYVDLLRNAESAKRRLEGSDRPRLAVAIDTSSIAVGALETLQALRDEIARRGLDMDVAQVGGNGLSFANPTVEYAKPGTRVLYQKVTSAAAAGLLDALTRGDLDNDWLLGAFDQESRAPTCATWRTTAGGSSKRAV
jgi:hypothetical protein